MPLITASALVTSSSGTGASSYATASITPTANSLVLAAVRANNGTTPNTPTATGCSLTWVAIDTQAITAAGKITLFRALGAAPTAGAVTFDFGGLNNDQCHWQVSEFANVDTSGTNGSGAIIQSAKVTTDSVTTITVTLAAFTSTNNATYGCLGSNNTKAMTEGTGFTELGEDNANSRTIETEWKNSNDTSVDWTVAANGDTFGAIAVEIKNLIPAGGFFAFLS